MPENFSLRVSLGRHMEIVEVTGSMLVRSLMDELGKRFDAVARTPSSNVFLKSGDVEIADGALQDYGLSDQDNLTLKLVRSRGKNRHRPSQMKHEVLYKLAPKVDLPKTELSKILKELQVPQPPPPLKLHREEDIIPLTANHLVFLETVSGELDQTRLQYEMPSGSSASIAGVIEDDANLSDLDENASLSKRARYNSDQAEMTVDRHQQLQLSEAELDEKYGKGFALIRSLGWSVGQALGSSESESGLQNPLKGGSPLSTLRAAGGGVGRHQHKDHNEITKKVWTEEDVKPPLCKNCSESRWPAYKMKGKWRGESWRESQWRCIDCASTVPECTICKRSTWNGYNLPADEQAGWLCATCWSNATDTHHHYWAGWFRCREVHYPTVMERDGTAERKTKEFHPFDWRAEQSHEGNVHLWREEQKEYHLGRPGWADMYWEGEYPSNDECSTVVDSNFLLQFLKTRPFRTRKTGSTQFCDTLFQPAVEKEDGWQYHAKKVHTVEMDNTIMRRKKGWTEGYHASYWACAHNVCCEGLKEGHDTKLKVPGVYHFDTLQRGSPYHRYQLFDDGVARVIVWKILADPAKTKPVKGKKKSDLQWATRESGIEVLGVYTRGYSRFQVETFVKGNPDHRPGMTLLSQWQPRYEAPVERWQQVML